MRDGVDVGMEWIVMVYVFLFVGGFLTLLVHTNGRGFSPRKAKDGGSAVPVSPLERVRNQKGVKQERSAPCSRRVKM